MENAERHLARWEGAGLIDANTAAAIRSFEATRTRQGGRQWMVLLVLILGGILLGAGVLLFVAAHWAELSPLNRMFLVLAMLVFFHGIGLLVRERFDALATAMHAVGTVSAGAAIALVGQIFNMQEHWPAAILLWALCAAAGWFLLRDQFQEVLTLLLLPAWIVSEWTERASSSHIGVDIYLARMLVVIGVVYLTAFLHSRKRAVFGVLFAVGAILIPIGIAILCDGWGASFAWPSKFVAVSYQIAAFAILLLAILFGTLLDRRSIAPACIALVVAYALPWAHRNVTQQFGQDTWYGSEPTILAYALVAAAAIFLVWWGVRTSAKALVNYGMAAFAATVVWFYFSSVMDKLGRSLGLIALGVLFLAGGWLLERTRRRLVSGIGDSVL